MIRKLFLAAALLVPILAYGQNPSADLSVQVGPPVSDPVCDQGPNYSGPVPAPAAAAGFTHCALNADFTTNTTDSAGRNFSNASTFIYGCGGNSSPTLWNFWLVYSDAGRYYNIPCNRAVITTDPTLGGQVLDLNYQDPTDNLPGYQGTYNEFDWPTNYFPLPGHNFLPQELYTEITIRIPASTLNNIEIGGALPFDLFTFQGTEGGPPNNGWISPDQFEIGGNTNQGATSWSGNSGMGAFNTTGGGLAPTYTVGQATYFEDFSTAYHTIGALVTSDESTKISLCIYFDPVTNPSPISCAYITASQLTALGINAVGAMQRRDNMLRLWFGDCGPSPCLRNSMDFYMKSFRVWMCSNYLTSSCPGPVIQSDLESHTRFAWFERALRAIKDTIIPPAYAWDTFDLPNIGFWVCPNGEVDEKIATSCKPPEFFASGWWLKCIPGRDDCVHTDTAFLGNETNPPWPAKRGSGFCYTKQPYTCSPDGKWPH